MRDTTDRDEESASPPHDPPEAGETRATLEAMRRRLRQHSALEDPGSLFSPEAQGRDRT